MRHIKKTQTLFLFLLFLPFCGCSEGGPREVPVEKKVPVKVAAASRGSITSYAHISGTTQPVQQAKLGSKVEGTIKEILADEGDWVKHGQVLLRLEPSDFILAIDQAKAALQTARAVLQQANSNLEQQANDWKRISALYEDKVVAKQRLDNMKAAYSIAQAQVEEGCAQVKQREAELGLAQRKFEDSVVRAPFGGVITKKMMQEGEVTSLWAYKWEALEIMDLSKVKIECEVSEALKSQLREGMGAEIKIDAFPDKTFTGKIDTIIPMVGPAQRTFCIKIIIPNPDRRLTAGMFARVKVALSRKDNVLVIPGNEILERPDGFFIFVVKDGVAQQRKISLGAREEKMSEVTDGLREGELVVTDGSHRLQNGYKVEVQSYEDS